MPEIKQQKSTPAGQPGDAPNALSLIGPDVAVRIGQAMMQGLAEQQSQMNEFLVHRLEADVRFQQQLAGCKSPAEVFAAFSAFTQSATRDYGEHAERIQNTLARTMSKGIERAD